MSENKIVLITGASRGIGRAAAIACARAGMQVVATGRAQKALEGLDDEIRAIGGLAPTIVPLDLTDFDGIDRLGGALFQRYGRIDGLVHAAAHLGDLMPLAHMTPRIGEAMIATNLTATWRLIRSMEPLLLQAPAPRAIFFTSGVVAKPRAFWGLYAATKAATSLKRVSLVATSASRSARPKRPSKSAKTDSLNAEMPCVSVCLRR